MPANNFKLFDENKQNMLNDQEYQASQQRLSGVQAGIASSMLNNKFAYQMSLVAYAITQMMNANGYDATDALVVSAFVGNLSDSVLQKVIDKATTAEAQAGTNTLKWMTPALVKSFFSYWQATQAEAQAGTNNTKWMSPASVKAFYSYMAATESMAVAGTDTTHWISPKVVKAAIDSSIRIGDIKTTARTDLGENWLLCNGEAVSAADYPELVNAMAGIENQELVTKELWSGSSSIIRINCLKYANGYWVAGGCYFSGSTFYARIAYATSLGGPWTTKDLWSYYGNVCEINCIEYADGYWVAGGTKNNQIAQVAYATTLSDTWTEYSFASSFGSINCIAYDDGYWVAGGTYLDETSGNRYCGVIYYTTSITGNWTKVVVFNDSGNGYPSKINCLIHANGYWVAGGVNRYGSNAYESIIAYVTTPGGSWTTLRVSTISSSTDGITGIGYANGYWAVCGKISTNIGQIAYATSLSGPWTIKNLDFNDIKGIAYINGEWFLCGQANIYYGTIAHCTSPGGQWLYLNLWGNPADYTGDSFVSCVEYANGLFAFGGYLQRNSSHYAPISYATGNVVLPAISLDGAYTYIKAKEA